MAAVMESIRKVLANPKLAYFGILKGLIARTRWYPAWYNRRYVGSESGDHVLDYWCNWGFQSRVQRRLGRDVVGFDLRRFDHWQRDAGTYLQADGRHVPIASGEFDLVVAALAVDYIDDDDGAMREIRRVLRDGGRLALSVANGTNLYSRATGNVLSEAHAREYEIAEIRELVTDHGFEIETVWTEVFYPPVFRSALIRYLPRPVWRVLGIVLPERYRGVIYLKARKV